MSILEIVFLAMSGLIFVLTIVCTELLSFVIIGSAEKAGQLLPTYRACLITALVVLAINRPSAMAEIPFMEYITICSIWAAGILSFVMLSVGKLQLQK